MPVWRLRVCGLQVEGKPSLEKSASLLEDKEDETVDIFSIQKVRGPTQVVPIHVSADFEIMFVRVLKGKRALLRRVPHTTSAVAHTCALEII